MCLPSQHPIREGNPTQHRTIKRRFDHGVSASSVTKKRVCPSITRKVGTQRTFGMVSSRFSRSSSCANLAGLDGREPGPIFHDNWGMFRSQAYTGNQAERDRNKETSTRKRNTSAFRRTKPSLVSKHAPSHLPASTGKVVRL